MRRTMINLGVMTLGSLFLSGEVQAAETGLPARTVALRDVLDKTIRYPGLDDPKATLVDVLDQVNKIVLMAHNVNLDLQIDDRAFESAGIADIEKYEVAGEKLLPPRNTSIRNVLRMILARLPRPADFVLRSDHIEITTQEAIRKEFYASDTRGPLAPLVTAHFEHSPLDKALNELAEQTGWSVVLDPKAIAKETPPVTATLKNVPLDVAVFLLADMADCASVSLGRTFYVTTKENARFIQQNRGQPLLPGGTKTASPSKTVTGQDKSPDAEKADARRRQEEEIRVRATPAFRELADFVARERETRANLEQNLDALFQSLGINDPAEQAEMRQRLRQDSDRTDMVRIAAIKRALARLAFRHSADYRPEDAPVFHRLIDQELAKLPK